MEERDYWFPGVSEEEGVVTVNGSIRDSCKQTVLNLDCDGSLWINVL